jgi:hypothetical protein
MKELAEAKNINELRNCEEKKIVYERPILKELTNLTVGAPDEPQGCGVCGIAVY